MSELQELNERLKTVILGTCNTIGCNDCDLKWKDENGKEKCSATDLQNKIFDVEMKEMFV